ncbi:MAG: patatin-like phospholipase family protein [Prevotella sp.]|nr:patatin-like phospholipase family protein [Prevotella sp.]
MKKIVLMIVAVLMAGSANAQKDNTDEKRKKVGVVLSGGGAKGMAHIGVLKVLEKAGIPIDYVTGTSIGSIVGGLYAIGYNSHSLDSMVRKQDWTYVITDKEDMNRQSYLDRKKQNTYLFSTSLTFGKRDLGAGGLIRGKNLAELFNQLCVGFSDSIDFNDLPIPFACVATNIMDNSEVVFHSGRLPQAMRASMAIPAAFSPVRIGDMVLVDGGLKNNFPVDVAREMGAEIVIGVTLNGKPKSPEDITGTMKIVGQIIDVNCVNKYDENKAITDLWMNVDPHGYSTASFSAEAVDSLIRYGEEEAMRHWDEIIALKKRIGIPEDAKSEILYPIRPNAMTDQHHVIEYVFENMTAMDKRFLTQKFHLDRVKTIDAELEQQLTTSMRVDLFYQTAECRVVPVKLPKLVGRSLEFRDSVKKKWDEADGVIVTLSAGDRKSVQLHGGVRYDTEENAAVQLGVDIPLRTALPVETDITLRLGKRVMARGEITVHPRSFTRPAFSYTFRRNDVDIYTGGDLDYNIRYNQLQAEFLPINFDLRHFNLQMGLRWDYMHFRNTLGSEAVTMRSIRNEHFISYRGRLVFNNEDDWDFPTRGSRFNAEYAYFTSDFAKLNVYDAEGNKQGKTMGMSDVSGNWRVSFTMGSRFTLQPMVYGRLLFGSAVPVGFYNTVGGEWFGHYLEQQMPFAGIGHLEYVRNHFVAAQLQAQERIGKSSYVLLRVAGGQQADKLRELFDYRTMIGVQGAFYYKTIFGPLGATLGYSNHTKKVHFYINLGYEF